MLLSELGWTAPGTDPQDATPDALIRREDIDDANWWPAYARIQALPAYHRLAHHQKIVDVIAALADVAPDEILVHPRKNCRVTFPQSAWPTPPHQDYPLIQGAADTFTAWLPLGDCPPELGALRVLRGSHRLGLRPPIPSQGVGGVGVDLSDGDLAWHSTSYAPGDVLIFLSLTVHYAPPNNGNLLRLSTDYRYQSVHDPVVDLSLKPHTFPLIPDWDELTVDWPLEDRLRVESPAGLDVQPMRMIDATLTAPQSQFVAAS